MKKLNYRGRMMSVWVRYATPRNRKIAYILLALVALAVAGGAPGAGSGTPGGGMSASSLGW